MFTDAQLQAISAHCLAKAAWMEAAPEPRQPDYAVQFFRENTKRVIAELRHISADALFLIDVPDCDNTHASLEQALDAWPELERLICAVEGKPWYAEAAE